MRVRPLPFRSLALLFFVVFCAVSTVFLKTFEAQVAEAQVLTVQFLSATSGSAESVASPSIEVTLSETSGVSNTVNYSVTGGTALGGGEDYTLANGTLTFIASDTSEMVPLTIINDLLREGGDTIQITLSDPTGNAVLGSTIVHTYTITDDETMTVQLNSGVNTLLTTAALDATVDVNSTGNFTAGTYGAYRWIKNSSNYLSLNVPFFSASSSQMDFSGASNHGTNSGAVNPANPATDCKVGTCLSFDGNDAVNFGSMTYGPAYTLSAWVKITSAAAIQTLIGVCDDPNSNCTGADYKMFQLRVNTDRSLVSAFSPTNFTTRRLQATTAAAAITLNTWTHVTTTVDSNFNTIRIYVNGSLQSVTTSNVGTGSGSFSKAFSMGALNVPFNSSKSQYLNGSLDEVQIYPRILTAAQITQIYNDGVAQVGGPRSIVAGETTIGDTWSLDVTHLGSVGATVSSNTVTITGELEAADIVLGLAQEDQDLIADFTPPVPWTGTVGYRWILDGTNWMNLNLPFQSGGTQMDISGYANHGTTYTSTTPVETAFTTSGCQVGGCLNFNGSTSYVTIPDSVTLLPSSAFTIQTWAKKSGAGTHDPRAIIFSKNGNYLDICYSGQVLFSIIINGVQQLVQGGTCASTGVWTQYVGTYDGSVARLYVNGVEVGSLAVAGTVTDNTTPLYLGRYNGDGYYLNGQIDEVQVYPSALTSSQIAQLYADGTNVAAGERGGPTQVSKRQHDFGETYELFAYEFSASGEISTPLSIGSQAIAAAATTTLVVTDPVETSGNITIDYTCENADGIPRDILVRFSTNGGSSFTNATLVSTSSGTINGSLLEGVACASGTPSANSFDWDSLADAAGVGVLNNAVRIQLIAQLAASDQDTTGNFSVFNNVTSTISSPTTIGAANTTYDNTHIVCNNTTLTVDGTHSFASMDLNGCTLTQTDSTASAANRTILTVLGNVDIDATSTVNLNAKGFVAGSNPSTGYSYVAGSGNEDMTATTNGSTGSMGGSHGGKGGTGTGGSAGVAGPAYGDPANPLYPGGGGGGWSNDANIGGDGGGYIRFVVAGTFTLNNTITANGGAPVTAGGAGAGGGIYISADTIAGTGTISAIGGNGLASNNEGGGGGGRIAIYYNTDNASNWTKNAYGGIDAGGGGGPGGAGTVYVKQNSGSAQLTINNNNLVSYAGSTPYEATAEVLGSMLITNRASVSQTNGATQAINVGTLTISNNSVLMHPDTTSTTVYWVSVNATDIDVQTTGSINVTGGGFIAGTNPSTGYSYVAGSGNETLTSTANGSSGAYGGSYGGVGGAGTGGLAGAAGAPYGDLTNPLYPGGGGGGWANDINIGGDGGGLIRLTASGTMTLNGTITANGGTPATAGGGGAGGGIYVNAGTITGTGTLSAVGGNGLAGNNEGGGGGGRIAIYYTTDSASNWTKSANGGSDANGEEGGAGTIYIKSAAQTYGDLTISNSTLVPADHSTLLPAGSQIQFDSVLITGNSRVSQTNGNTAPLTIGTLTVTGSAQLMHSEATATTANKLNIVATTVDVTSTGSINANGRGFGGGSSFGTLSGTGYTFVSGSGNETQATTTGGPTSASGGSYGGVGGTGTGSLGVGAVGSSYGDLTDPLYPGGGGGAWGINNSGWIGGDGGGLVRMTVSGTFTLNGTLLANGTNAIGAGGGGAGGGVYINANTLVGTGTVSAIGGNGANAGANAEGGGGGGRIAIYYTTDSGTWTKNAYGGNDAQGPEGGAGTVYLKSAAQTYGDLIINNSTFVPPDHSTLLPAGPALQFDSVLITGNSRVTQTNGNTTALQMGALTITGSAQLMHPDATTTTAYRLNISADSVDIALTGSINANARGFLGGNAVAPLTGTGYTFVSGVGNETQTANTGPTSAAGGGYGGSGGTGSGTLGVGTIGASYGELTNPLYPGGGGAGWGPNNSTWIGGDGGGLVRLTVSGTMTLNGSIVANGANASGAGGGGAGGGIYIDAGTLQGTGTVSAIGGNGLAGNNEGGGGGGRIAIYYTTDSGTWTKNAYGGSDPQGGEGGAGTIYLEPFSQAGSLVLNGNNLGTLPSTSLFTAGSATQYVFQDLSVINSAGLTVASPGVCSPNAITVRGTITTTSGTITHNLLDSNGIRCVNRVHQYLNYPVSLTFTQPDIDAYDYYKRFSDTGVLQFALHSNLLYNSNNIDLTALTYEQDGTRIALSVPADSNLHTKHALYIPNTNGGYGVYLCPTATTLAAVTPACSGRVTFAPSEFGGAGKTVGSATGVTVTLVNATDTGAGTSGNATHLYKVVGLANTGGGPYENVEFTLNTGNTTATAYEDVQVTNITTNGVSGLPASTDAAYRWTVNGVNMMTLNVPFNSAGSVQSDVSGNGINGTVSGAVNPATPATDCKVGTCLSFDGVNDNVSFGDVSAVEGISEISWSAWIYPTEYAPGTATTNVRSIVSKGAINADNTSVFWSIFQGNGAGGHIFNCGVDSTTGFPGIQVDAPTYFPLNTWTHFTVTWRSGDPTRLYVNGALVTSTSAHGGVTNNTSNPLYIGFSNNGSTPQYYQGSIDEVQIYPRALSPEQIAQNYADGNAGVGGPTLLKPEETTAGTILNAYITPVGLDGVVGATVASANTVTISSPLVNFSLANQTQAESVANTNIEVTLSAPDALGTNTVDYAVTGTAVGGGKDYTLANGTLTFIANDTSEIISLAVIDDVLKEDSETVVITLNSTSANILLGSTIVHTYTITDNETMTVGLNGGVTTLDTALPLSSSVDVNTTGNFTAATTGAYRWTVNGVNWATLNIPFNLGSSHLDFSGNSFTGTPTNGAAYDSNFSNCKVGGCLSLDGVNDYVAHSTSVLSGNTGAFTVSAWMNVNSIASSQTIISKDDRTTATPRKMFQIQTTAGADIISGSTLAAYVWDESANAFIGRSITSNPSGAWHHIAFVYDGGTAQSSVRLYYDNVEQSGIYSSGSFAGIDDTSGPVMVGAYTTTAGAVSRFFGGRIDEVQIYPRALSAVQIDQLYDDGVALVGGPTVIEPEETVGGQIWELHVTHLGSVGATVTSANTVTISAPLINFALGIQSQNESIASPTVEVIISVADPLGPNTVNYAITGGTAIGGGKDYTLASGVLTFVANDTSEMIPLSVVDDILRENDETISITLNSPSGNAVLGTSTSHTYTITDNETMAVVLNGGVATLSKSSPLTRAVDVNSTGDFTAGTQGAYRWIVDGQNFASLNVPFAEGSIQEDVSGNNFDGTVVQQAAYVSSCKVGGCISLDGVDDAVNHGNVSALDSTANFTVSAWVYPDSLTASHHRVFSEEFVGYVGRSAGNITFYIGNGSAWNTQAVSGLGTMTAGQWQHIVWVKEGTTARVYKNGILQGSVAAPATTGTSTRMNCIGTYDVGGACTGTQFWNGDIDEFQIYRRALTLAQIEQLCADGNGGVACAGTVNQSSVGLGGPSIIAPSELLNGQVWNLDVTHMGSMGATVTSSNTVTIFSPEASFALANQSQSESVLTPSLEVTLSAADSTASNTVNYAVTGGTAVGSGEDYTLASGTLTFLANDTSESIPLTIVNDLLKEGNDTIIITLSAPSTNIVLGTTTTHTYTITDDETMVVSLNPNYPVGNPLSNNFLSAANPLESSVNVNSTGDFSAGTIGAYRWIKNGADYAHFSMPFNSGATQLDLSGNTASSVLLQSNAAHTATGCKVGGCLGLDGADDVAIIRNVANTAQSTIFNSSTSLSISAWVKSTTAGIIISNHNSGSTWESVWLDTSTFVINAANSNAATRKVLSYPTVADGNWHHVVAVWTGANMYVYVDGAQVAGPLAQASPPWATTQLTYVGALHVNAGAPTTEITGAIDELQIYKRVLSAQQIAAMYNEGLGSGQNANDGVGSPASIVAQELTVGDEWSVDVTHLGSVGSTVSSSNTVEIVSSLGAMQLNGDANDEVEEDVDVEFSFVGTPVTNSTLGFQWLVDPDGVGAGAQQKFMAINVPMNSGSTQIDVSGNNRDSTVQGGNVIAVESTLTGGGNQARYDSINGVAGLPFTIPATACLNYDIAWKGDERIGVDFSFTPIYDPPGPLAPSGDLRDTLLPDQNGYATHPDENISPVASDGVTGYYSRQINVSVLAGRQITNYTIGSEWNGPETKTAYIANIRLTNCSGVTLQTVYSSGVATFSNVVNSNPGNVTNYRTGPPSFQTSGCKVGGCYSFNGSPGALESPSSEATNTFSIEFWAKPTATRVSTTEQNSDLTINGVNGQRYAVYPGSGGATDAGVGVSVGTNGVSVFEHGNDHLPSLLVHDASITDWTHVVVTYDLKRPKLYLNGSLVRTGLKSLRTTIRPGVNLGGTPFVGAGGRGDTYGPYMGLLDEFRIYPRVITPQQIAQNYQDGLAGNGGPTQIVSQEHDVDEVWTLNVFEVTNIGGLADTAIPVDTVTIVPGDSETYMGITTPPSSPTLSNDVTLTYTCRNDTGLPRDIIVEFSTNGGSSWASATVKSSSTAGGVSENNILAVPCSSTLPDGSTHTFVWDSYLDAAGSSGVADTDIRVRVTADTAQVGASVLTASTGNFTVQNARYITSNASGTFSGDVICEGGDTGTPVTITMDGTQNLTSLTLLHGCVLTHTLNSSTPLAINVTGNVYIDASSQINIDAKGHLGALTALNTSHNGEGTGGGIGASCFGCPSSGGGGSYGGKGANGGVGNAGVGGAIFGDYTDPVSMGSGGGGHSSGSSQPDAGHGGGLVIFNVNGTFQNEGLVTANGQDGASFSGGGSGGGINITAAQLTGSGSFRANGGSSSGVDGPSGGGGRIALKATSGTVSGSYAYDAYSFTDSGGEIGGAGTIYIQEGISPGRLILDNNDNVPQLAIQDVVSLITGVQTLDEVIVRDKAMLSYDSAWTIGTLTVDDGTLISNALDQLTIDTVSVINGGNLTTRDRDGIVDYSLNLSVQDMTIDATSTIDLDERGYRGGLSDGNTSYYGEGAGGGVGSNCFGCPVASGGGGHGGKGANGTGANHNNAGGAAYGSYDDPVTMGGGGGATGSGSATAVGGDGGGLVIITAANSFIHNGVISSNGGAMNSNRGSGAGGGISITAGTLTGSGTIRANGGASGNPSGAKGGSGAGGRIALVATTGTVSNTYTLQAFAGGGTGNISGAGTIYRKDASSNPDLIIDANNLAPTEIDVATPLTPLSPLRTLSISNDAALTASVAFTIDDLVVDGGTFLSAINTAHSITATTITNGGNVTVPVRTSTTDYSLRINGATLTVDATSTINLDGKGYRAGSPPTSYYGEGSGGGAGGDCFGCSYGSGGGAHGANGASGTASTVNGAGGAYYGSLTDPLTMGSGGGGRSSGSAVSSGGYGGGLLVLDLTGVLTNNGIISANGTTGTGGGGGAGGGMNIAADSISGNGSFTANGGSSTGSTHGNGSGGRIAAATSSNIPSSVTFLARSGNSAGPKAGAGTIYLNDGTYPDLIIDNGSVSTSIVTPLFLTGGATQYQFQDFAVRNGAVLNVNAPGTCSPFAVVIRGTVDTTGGTVNHGLNDSNGLRCMNRVHQYQNFPATLTLTQPDIDNYDFHKRFRLSSNSTLQFALHSHLLYNNSNIDLTGLVHETNGTKIAISIPSDPNLHTRHTLYIPNTNSGAGVSLCPNATTLAGVNFGCSGKVNFTSSDISGAVAKTVGAAAGVIVTMVNATDTGVGSALYKVIGLSSTGGGPIENITFDLNDGIVTAGDNTDVQITNVEVDNVPGIPADTNFAYRWSSSGTNFMALNMPFNSGTTQTDFSGNTNNGTATNNPAFTTSGCKVGNCLTFNGSNTYVNVPNSASLSTVLATAGALTTEAWIKIPTTTPSYSNIFEKFAADNTGFELAIDVTNVLRFDLGQGGASYCPALGTTNLEDNAWHHVVATYDGANIRLYVDNVLQNTTACVSALPSNTRVLSIARDSTIAGRYFNGLIDEARIYPRALSAAQINQLYVDGNGGFGGPSLIDGDETSLAEVWNLTITPIGIDGTVYTPYTSANTVTISPVPEAITDLATTAGNTQVTLTWTAPGDNGSPITDYIVEYNSGAGYQVFNDGVSASAGAVVTGLSNGASYTFRVKAVNANGESAYSNVDTETPATVPSAVTDLAATAGNTQVVLTWTAPAANGSAITDYIVEFGATSGFPGNAQVFNDGVSTTTGATVTGLVNGTDYSFQVKAVNGAGQGNASNVDTATPVHIPEAVSDLNATPGNTQVVLTWSAPANNGSAITDYIVEYGATSGFPGNIQVFSDGVSATTGATVTGLVNGADYSFQVKAVNAIGTGPASNVDTATPNADAPSAINNLSASSGNAQVSLTWSAPADNGAAITDYIVEFGATSGFPGNAQVFNDGTSASTGAIVTGLVNGTDYTFRVAAVNAIGTGPYSNTDNATPLLIPPSGSDTQITVDVSDFLSFSITNVAVGDEPAGNQPFGAGAQVLSLSNQSAHVHAISGDATTPVLTELEISTNSGDGCSVSLYAAAADSRTAVLLRTGGVVASPDEIADSVARLATAQSVNDTLAPTADTGIAFRVVRTGTTADIYGADEITQWGSDDTTNALWASPPLGSGNARVIFSTTQFNASPMQALINWFVGVGINQRAGVYSGSITLSASVN